MKLLEPKVGETGVWINPAWNPGDPGLFAVIIGVSNYAHLADGKAPATDTFELGQLTVSALTAYRLFEWLGNEFHIEGCPVAKCWYLVAPTDAERQIEPQIDIHALLPSHNNCKSAIGQWFDVMQKLPGSAAATSRSLFFFSGHGLEIHHEQQILLPTDYLAPPVERVNDAISTQNLKIGVSALRVPHHVFLVDACRNACQRLKDLRVEGDKILNERVSASALPELVVPVLYSTTSGQQSYSPSDPKNGLSLFGQALIEGLRGTPDIQLRAARAHDLIHLFPLQTYVKTRVSKLIADAGSSFLQPVRLGGTNDDICITSVERQAGQALAMKATDWFESQQSLESLKFTKSTPVDFEYRLKGWPADYNTGIRGVFGSERATELFSTSQLYAMESKKWIGADALRIVGVDRTDDRSTHRVNFEILNRDKIGHWIQLVDSQRATFGCLLPTDQSLVTTESDAVFTVEVDRFDGAITRFEAGLSAGGAGQLSEAARLWRRYQIADLQEALSDYDQGTLKQLVFEKRVSCLAATTAALVLVRANRLRELTGQLIFSQRTRILAVRRGGWRSREGWRESR